MRIAILEDHTSERRVLELFCRSYFDERADLEDQPTIKAYATADEFLQAWSQHRFDLVLLDCYLTDDESDTHSLTGFDVARSLRTCRDDCPIVFITSSSDFAVLGYAVQASGYLLKPVNRADFTAMMDRVTATMAQRASASALMPNSPGGKASAWQETFGSPPTAMDRRCIVCCLSHAHYVEFTFSNGSRIRVRVNFSDVERRLTSFGNFYRTARGALVNFDYAAGIDGNEFVMRGGKRVPITKTATAQAGRAYAQYMFERIRKDQ